MKKKPKTIPVEFRKTGPKTSIEALQRYPIRLPDDVQSFLLATNGGAPVNQFFQFFADDDREQILCLDYFYGATRPKADDFAARRYDIANACLEYRDHLPRWSIPLGRVDDDSFLLTFYGGKHDGEICYFIWIHDDHHEDNDPNDDDGLYVLNNSLTDFIGSLSPYEAFRAVRSLPIINPDLKPSVRGTKLKSLGCSRLGGTAESLESWTWDRFSDQTNVNCEVYVRSNASKLQPSVEGISLPNLIGFDRDTTVLHFVYSRHVESEALAMIRKAFGDTLLYASRFERLTH
jgi:hypothetical protein